MTTATIDRPTGEIPRIAAVYEGRHRPGPGRPSYSDVQAARVAEYIEHLRAEVRAETAEAVAEAVAE